MYPGGWFLSGGITHAPFGGIGIGYFAGINPVIGAAVLVLCLPLVWNTFQYVRRSGKTHYRYPVGVWNGDEFCIILLPDTGLYTQSHELHCLRMFLEFDCKYNRPWRYVNNTDTLLRDLLPCNFRHVLR
ncbi:MAG: metal ABC transporter permease [Bacteroidales bacterium]|nr:metal ABC transporter permease [Bacteroidales bacterium]